MHRPFLILALLAGCTAPPPHPLAEYVPDAVGPSQNTPDGYVAYLRQTRFTHGELDRLPPYAILLHGDPDALLPAAGFPPSTWTTLELGTTDPSRLYVVRPPGGRTPFVVNRATPGGGGAATQAAELTALGCRTIVHVGTSGLLGDGGDDAHVIVATAAYKDGAAVLLSDDPAARLARPDPDLTRRLLRHLGPKRATPGVGYTIPIYYYQPERLVRDLIAGDGFAASRPTYLEMEESPVFATARRAGAAAASLTAAADRYAIAGNDGSVGGGTLWHSFLDDGHVSATLATAVRAAADVFDDLAHARPTTAP